MFGSTAKIILYANDATSTLEGDANGNKEKNRGQKARRKTEHCKKTRSAENGCPENRSEKAGREEKNGPQDRRQETGEENGRPQNGCEKIGCEEALAAVGK
jgi:hypothetical protein